MLWLCNRMPGQCLGPWSTAAARDDTQYQEALHRMLKFSDGEDIGRWVHDNVIPMLAGQGRTTSECPGGFKVVLPGSDKPVFITWARAGEWAQKPQ